MPESSHLKKELLLCLLYHKLLYLWEGPKCRYSYIGYETFLVPELFFREYLLEYLDRESSILPIYLFLHFQSDSSIVFCLSPRLL